jgi:hypothetical protein
MHRRTVHRGMFALAIVTSLAFAGARPAAARELGLKERLNHLWSAVTGAGPGAWAQLTDWLGDKPAHTKKGWGMDPNGAELDGNSSTTPPPSDPTGLQ